MSELLLHVVVKLLQVDLEGVVLEVVVGPEVIVLEHGLVDQPQSKGIAKYWPKLLLQVERERGPPVPVSVQDAQEWIEVVLAQSTEHLVFHHAVG